MTWLDKYLQRWRIRKALAFIAKGNSVLDIGSHQGELLLMASAQISNGLGIDPLCITGQIAPKIHLRQGMFPQVLGRAEAFNCITALAVLEHIPTQHQPAFMAACHQHLLPNGLLIITVPNAIVDKILAVLTQLKLVKGMSLEEHFGFNAASTPALAKQAGFTMEAHKKFQLGVNNLFVFRKE